METNRSRHKLLTQENAMKKQCGLILVELIAVIVLVGIIASFTTYFLYTGIQGYLSAKNTVEGSLNAQMALDRIAHELRNIDYFTSAPVVTGTGDRYISYTSADVRLTGTRRLKYSALSDTIYITTNADYPLLENVSEFNLSVTYKDMDFDGSTDYEVAGIEVGFKVHDIGREFKTSIYPRHMVEKWF
jgi:type II secretory pathway pseudopilin PulG